MSVTYDWNPRSVWNEILHWILTFGRLFLTAMNWFCWEPAFLRKYGSMMMGMGSKLGQKWETNHHFGLFRVIPEVFCTMFLSKASAQTTRADSEPRRSGSLIGNHAGIEDGVRQNFLENQNNIYSANVCVCVMCVCVCIYIYNHTHNM